jgi:F0F1-type ATP synthase membrane subunit b/b'
MIFTNLDVQRQKELFSSLKIEQWEEAGDWFQGRFSEIFQKLKDARKKRRELASAFEKRIAQRQQALTKKRNITEEALSEMRKSGTQVLESTPRKKQRFTE